MSRRADKTIVLATDQQCTVLNAVGAGGGSPFAYMPYGYRMEHNSLLAFNGELPDPTSGNYHLGNGYRQYSPVLMRFHSPDSESPFRAGGFNPYAYCDGDPRNRVDPTGHRAARTVYAYLQQWSRNRSDKIHARNIKNLISGAGATHDKRSWVIRPDVFKDNIPDRFIKLNRLSDRRLKQYTKAVEERTAEMAALFPRLAVDTTAPSKPPSRINDRYHELAAAVSLQRDLDKQIRSLYLPPLDYERIRDSIPTRREP